MQNIRTLVLAIGAAIALSASQAQAVTFGFDAVTNNVAGNPAIAEAQLFVDVTNSGGGQVLFKFNNIGPVASVLTQIVFEDTGSLFDTPVTSIFDQSSGVDFAVEDPPGNLIGGFTEDLGAGAVPPPSGTGVQPGEFVSLLLTLAAGNFSDVIAALMNANLRIGIHVQAIGAGGSEKLINNLNAVPIPAALPLFVSGLGLIAWLGRRKRRTARPQTLRRAVLISDLFRYCCRAQ